MGIEHKRAKIIREQKSYVIQVDQFIPIFTNTLRIIYKCIQKYLQLHPEIYTILFQIIFCIYRVDDLKQL